MVSAADKICAEEKRKIKETLPKDIKKLISLQEKSASFFREQVSSRFVHKAFAGDCPFINESQILSQNYQNSIDTIKLL